MKRSAAFLLLFSLFIWNASTAQLVLGGDITWECIGSGANAGKYIFQLTLFNQSDSGQLGTTQTLNVIGGPVSTISLTKLSEEDINPPCYDTAQEMSCSSSSPGVMSMAIYKSSPITLSGVPGVGGWIFTWKTNYRELAFSNLSAGSGMTLRSVMYSINNSNANPCMDNSPQFLEAPITGFCKGYQSNMSHRAYDPDGDEIVYSFDDPLETYTSWPAAQVTWKTGYSTTSPMPGTAINPSNVNAVLSMPTGEMTFNALVSPEFLTYYVVKVRSIRNGNIVSEVNRELVIHQLNCPPATGIPPLSNAPPLLLFKPSVTMPPYPDANPVRSVNVGDTVRFHVDVNDMQFLPGFLNQTITMIPRGRQFGTKLIDPLSGCDQPPCAVLDTSGGQYDFNNEWFRGAFGTQTSFLWMPDSVHGSPTGELYQFHFYAQDDWCPYPGMQEHTFSVRVYSAPENTIEGTVFKDLNGNGTQDAGENGIPNILVRQMPSNFYYNTGSNGEYSLGAYQGPHIVSLPSIPKYHQISAPAGGQYSLSISGSGTTFGGNDFGLEPIPNVNDLEIDLQGALFHRPGMSTGYWIHYKNTGTTTLSGSVDFNYSGPLNFISSTPIAASTGAGTASWNFNNLGPGQSGSINVSFMIDTTATTGDSISSYVTINPVVGDTTPTNNMDSLLRIVSASYDPNIKHSNPDIVYNNGFVLQSDVQAGLPIEYTIEFQNTGNDTAFDIRVEDVVNQTLDLESFEFIGSSDPATYQIRDHKITFWLDNIQLPPSATDAFGSIGFVKFRIKANANLQSGDTMENTADIFFDFNFPISTTAKNAIVNQVTDGISESLQNGFSISIYPNPSSDIFNIDVSDLAEPELKFELYSVSGQKRFDGRVNQNESHTGNALLDLSDYPRGIYFIRFEGQGQVITKKIVLH